jgi:hypothetical protein
MVDPLSHPTSGPSRYASLVIGAAGLLAGLIAFGLGEMTYGYFAPEDVPQAVGGGQVLRPTLETQAVASARNSALTFGSMGVVLGLVLGLAGGLSRRSIGAGARAGAIGLFLGVILGVALPMVLVVPFHRMQNLRDSDDLLVPLGMHLVLWGPLGAIGGLAFGLGRGATGRTLLALSVGGLAGAVVGTIVYEVIAPAIPPLTVTTDPISGTWPTRLLARLLVPVGTAMAIILADRAPKASS